MKNFIMTEDDRKVFITSMQNVNYHYPKGYWLLKNYTQEASLSSTGAS